jgi:hypothetical protein
MKEVEHARECFNKTMNVLIDLEASLFSIEDRLGMTDEEDEGAHLGCPAYPNCDEDPNGCIVVRGTANVEWYGHRD